ncbi:hypothetical protein FISHEDRAFT_67625 [Fistulina hepatica ATCC 64428]|nr:hypothetical protein FISHEDRAFT_67625 [Fistulina hepatica ATCC 64428]
MRMRRAKATVLIVFPYDTEEHNLNVLIDRNYIVASVDGQPPAIKGRLYGEINPAASDWQLEPRTVRPHSARERTTSSVSSASAPSSYAFVDDSFSNFAVSSAQASEAGDAAPLSPQLSSPVMLSSPGSGDERELNTRRSRAKVMGTISRPTSLSMQSSYSSMDSLPSRMAGRLVTLHLEKTQSVIWPSLIVGPVPESMSPQMAGSLIFNTSNEMEHQYNMDPTSLVLIGLDLQDIRKNKVEAFEYFVHAWHQARLPAAAIRLASSYVPTIATLDPPTEPGSSDTTLAPVSGVPYYVRCLGGPQGLAALYLEAGFLHLEGGAARLMSPSFTSLASIRVPHEQPVREWQHDREAAMRYFERAQALDPSLDVPELPLQEEPEFEMPSIDLSPNASTELAPRRHRSTNTKREEPDPRVSKRAHDDGDLDSTWYLYIPGLLGAGAAILVVGALSLSTWSRRTER